MLKMYIHCVLFVMLFCAMSNALTDYSSQALILNEKLDFACGGALISQYIVITTAYCIWYRKIYTVRLASDKMKLSKDAYMRIIYYEYTFGQNYFNNYGLLIFNADMSSFGNIAPMLKTNEKVHKNEKVYTNYVKIIDDKVDNLEEVLTVQKRFGLGGCQSMYDKIMVNNQTICVYADVKKSRYVNAGVPIYKKDSEENAILAGIVVRIGSYDKPIPILGLRISDVEMQAWVKGIH